MLLHRRQARPKNDLSLPTERAVEQAIARGLDDEQIADMLPVTAEQAADVRLWLDELVYGDGYKPPLAPCGTRSAYGRHKRHGEPVDAACQLAENAYQTARKRHYRRRGAA